MADFIGIFLSGRRHSILVTSCHCQVKSWAIFSSRMCRTHTHKYNTTLLPNMQKKKDVPLWTMSLKPLFLATVPARSQSRPLSLCARATESHAQRSLCRSHLLASASIGWKRKWIRNEMREMIKCLTKLLPHSSKEFLSFVF